MKHIEYSINDIKQNVEKNVKGMILIFICFLLLGIIVGILQNMNYAQQKYTLDDTIVEKVNLDDNDRNETYFYVSFCEIKNKYNTLYAYVQYLKQVEMNGKNVESLLEFEEGLLQFKQDYYDEMSLFYMTKTPIIYSDFDKSKEFLEGNIESYENAIETYSDNLEILNGHSFSKLFIDSSESKIYEGIKNAEREKVFWESHLNTLQSSDIKELEESNKEMELKLVKAEKELNQQVLAFNGYIKQLEEEEQYDVIYNKYLLKSYLSAAGITGELSEDDILSNRKNNAIIYAKSIAGLDMPKERFCAVLLFFMLTGITLSLLYGGFFSKGKKEDG